MKGILHLRKIGAPYNVLKQASINATNIAKINLWKVRTAATPDDDGDETDWESNGDDAIYSTILPLLNANKSENANRSQNIPLYTQEGDVYTPKVSTWGVFERPKNISQTHGGGKVINKVEMEKIEQASREIDLTILPPALKMEQDKKKEIEDAVARSRGFMMLGNSSGAVAILETTQNLTSYQTEFGGNAKLELAMALETVGRLDEARTMYNKLAALSWSDKVRRNAGQLAAGLEVFRSVEKVIPATPSMDALNMKLVSQALEAGLKSEWSDYKRKESTYAPWFGDSTEELSPRKSAVITTIDSLQAAYSTILQYLLPMKGISDQQLKIAVKKFHTSSVAERAEFLLNETHSSASPNETMYSTAMMKALNGSWELVATFQDTIGGAVKHVTSGQHLRNIDTKRSTCTDFKHLALWGMFDTTLEHKMQSDFPDMKLHLNSFTGTQCVQVHTKIACFMHANLTSSLSA